MKYLMLFYKGHGPRREPGTPEFLELLNAYNEADSAMRRAGVLVECAPLEPTTSSTTVRVRGGETLLTDGPAAEIKEQVGGFALVECADLDEAIRWAATIPAARDASVEIRPLVNVEVPT
ncbi:MAG TPA: YciI family protein [Acidimicrobiales bacterium]|nr:YciI family protein [Acidimicrobiales bacterium]